MFCVEGKFPSPVVREKVAVGRMRAQPNGDQPLENTNKIRMFFLCTPLIRPSGTFSPVKTVSHYLIFRAPLAHGVSGSERKLLYVRYHEEP